MASGFYSNYNDSSESPTPIWSKASRSCTVQIVQRYLITNCRWPSLGSCTVSTIRYLLLKWMGKRIGQPMREPSQQLYFPFVQSQRWIGYMHPGKRPPYPSRPNRYGGNGIVYQITQICFDCSGSKEREKRHMFSPQLSPHV